MIFKIESCGIYIIACLLSLSSCQKSEVASYDYKDCTIYRDQWGVPHIHGKADRDVAYGLAWASCEDDFITLQEQMLALKGKYGEVRGKDGVVADIAIQYMGIREYARTHMDEIEEETKSLIDGYISGANAYARLHPNELLSDDLFPVRPYEVVAGYLLGLVEISGAGSDLAKLADGSIVKELHDEERGSNAIAVSAKKTDEGQTFLAINSHQPMQGWYSWYEAHLISDDGMNILGGTFPGAATIFHGTNEHLGWAHTVNQGDFSDVYQLTMHPDKPHYYLWDGQWYPLKHRVIRSWVKIAGPLKIPITRSIYQSKYGVTFKVDDQYFSWRFQAQEAVKAIEQWYKMSKATSLNQWKDALDIMGIPCTNIVYADKADNIFYISNARQPKKDQTIDWSEVITDTGGPAIWPDEDWPIDSLPQVLNPQSGFVFNTNNTPYSSSGPGSDPPTTSAHRTMGYMASGEENNRSLRFQELMDTVTTLTYDEFLTIKYDRTYPNPLKDTPYEEEPLLNQDPKEHGDIAAAIILLNNWDRSTDEESTAAALFLLAREALRQIYMKNEAIVRADYITAITSANDELIKDHGQLDVRLGDFQRHRRGEVDLPMGGGSDVLGAIYSRKDDDLKYAAFSGESYIQLVRFDSLKGPIIESVNAYGSSARPSSPHYTDQMDLFVKKELKPMTLDLEVVKSTAVKTYHPRMIK